MKRVSILLLLALCSCFSAMADTYIIKVLSTPYIEINGSRLKVGSTFSDSDVIKWSSSEQIMEVVKASTHEKKFFSGYSFKCKDVKTIKDYMNKIYRGSTRDVNIDMTLTAGQSKEKYPEKRVALIIANTNYDYLAPLRNPVYDGIALTTKLSELGFDVYTAYDCNTSDMTKVLKDFSGKAGKYDIALFYYSGHGVQEKNINYLIPVNRKLDHRVDLDECVKCELVKELFEESKCKSRLLYFDACRSSKSWTHDAYEDWGRIEGDLGTYITFSTKSGNVAYDGDDSNSPFAKSMLKYIDEPIDFLLMMRKVATNTNDITNHEQTPVATGDLREGFCFNPSSRTNVAVTATQTVVKTETKAPSTQPVSKTTTASRTEAKTTDAASQIKLGEQYYGEENYVEAVKWFRKAAEQGNAYGQSWLGYCYYYGEGVAKDYAEAVNWYRKAADQGNASAQNNLGFCYYNGEGVTKDYAEAVNWYRKAAEQGNATAQNNLGNRYYFGEGVAKDYAEAVNWYRKSAEQGDATAQNNLGNRYYYGEGVAKDYAEAVNWYRKAAEQGNAYGQSWLGYCYYYGEGVAKDYAEAVNWYRKAAEQGYAIAQNNLGNCYYNCEGVAKDYAEAVKWFRKAAEQGYAKAQFSLGDCYENGKGVNVDKEEAIKWYGKAAEQSHNLAKSRLENLLGLK